MITIKTFVFGPFQENTYLLFDESKECVIIDPGCYDSHEREELSDFIEANKLKPVKLLNTHCHLDHMFGNGFITEVYKIKPEFDKNEQLVFDSYLPTANMYNLEVSPTSAPEKYIKEGYIIKFGNSNLEIISAPGHSPGSLVFYNREQKFMMAGDVLFYRSIGRSDLPGGNHNTLITSIQTKLLPLGDDYTVYSGHGQSTSIGFERLHNPFLNE